MKALVPLIVFIGMFQANLLFADDMDNKIKNSIALCSAGLSETTTASIVASLQLTGGTLSAGVREEIRGAIFNDPTISSADKAKIYSEYIKCAREVLADLRKEERRKKRLKNNPELNLEILNHSNSYERGGSLGWIINYSITVRNTGSKDLDCLVLVKSKRIDKETRRTLRTFNINNHEIDVDSNDTEVIEDEIESGPVLFMGEQSITAESIISNCKFDEGWF